MPRNPVAPPPPVPPVELPPARTVTVPGRGEFFLRDSGLTGPDHADRPVVLLLHGWTATADINWAAQYDDVIAAGYRVLGIDHRGHGRGLRTVARFRLEDCSDDTAAVLRHLELAPAIVVGYSMGGAIAQLMARDHADVIRGLVLSATAQRFAHGGNRRQMRTLPLLRAPLATAPRSTWRILLAQLGLASGSAAGWLTGEMLRHDPHAIIDAGRELQRFDSRPWLKPLAVPSAYVLTTADDVVPAELQQEVIAATAARVFEAAIRHMQITHRPADYNPALLSALAHVHAQPPDVSVVCSSV